MKGTKRKIMSAVNSDLENSAKLNPTNALGLRRLHQTKEVNSEITVAYLQMHQLRKTEKT